jgi:hypothetical protein
MSDYSSHRRGRAHQRQDRDYNGLPHQVCSLGGEGSSSALASTGATAGVIGLSVCRLAGAGDQDVVEAFSRLLLRRCVAMAPAPIPAPTIPTMTFLDGLRAAALRLAEPSAASNAFGFFPVGLRLGSFACARFINGDGCLAGMLALARGNCGRRRGR